jgi:hypothetical protein
MTETGSFRTGRVPIVYSMFMSSALMSRPGFSRYAAARLVSTSGTAVSFIAFPVSMYDLTASATWTAAIAIVESIPYLLFGLLAGAKADRVSKIALMMGADIVSAAALMTVPVAHGAGVLHPFHLLVTAAIVQTAFVFFDAADIAILPALVGRDKLVDANSLLISGSSAVEAASPIFAALAMTKVASPWLLGFDAVTFLTSALLLAGMGREIGRPIRGSRNGNFWGEVREGLIYLLGNRVASMSTAISACVCVAYGTLVALMVVWAREILGIPSGDARLGMLFTAQAVGGMASGLLTAGLGRKLSLPWMTRLLLPCLALSAFLLTFAVTWWESLFAIALTSWLLMASLISVVSIRQRCTPDFLQGRVNTTGRMLAYGAGFATGGLIAASLAPIIGVVATMRISFGVLVLGTALAWLRLPSSFVSADPQSERGDAPLAATENTEDL